MSTYVLLPIGRLLWGSVHKPNTTDQDGNPLVSTKPGPTFGQAYVEYAFGVGIPKEAGKQWWESEWGLKIYQAACEFWPQGQATRGGFSFKIKDGDSTEIPKGKDKPLNSKTGYPGHWVLAFKSQFPPKYTADNGTKQLTDASVIKTGHYVQVYCTIGTNARQDNPGIIIYPDTVNYSAYGVEINNGVDPATIGFGGALPQGATAAPVASSFNPAPPAMAAPAQMPAPPGAPAALPSIPALPSAGGLPMPPAVAAAPALPVAAPAPLPVAPPVVAAAPVLVQVPGAQYTIEQCRAGNWTDQQLIDNGIARWETPSGVQPVPSFLTGPAQ